MLGSWLLWFVLSGATEANAEAAAAVVGEAGGGGSGRSGIGVNCCCCCCATLAVSAGEVPQRRSGEAPQGGGEPMELIFLVESDFDDDDEAPLVVGGVVVVIAEEEEAGKAPVTPNALRSSGE